MIYRKVLSQQGQSGSTSVTVFVCVCVGGGGGGVEWLQLCGSFTGRVEVILGTHS